ncbi:hypothetical protein CKAH01_06904 [Colletotrichum kahawae]|uniref:SCA7 domain-containing protein n=1 Tax=Colletotrichum kahawae TaxID=34407 RepID=A0AAE0D2Y4_COLKA|nr:hypothetical protein CKAH01_06904 [Colletotrichum kahawae]
MMSSAHSEGTVVAGGNHVPLGEETGAGQMHPGRRRRRRTGEPIDIERQCGVAHTNGRVCGAALTCRRHSMGAKRAVAGRSAPFDALLSALMEQRRQ